MRRRAFLTRGSAVIGGAAATGATDGRIVRGRLPTPARKPRSSSSGSLETRAMSTLRSKLLLSAAALAVVVAHPSAGWAAKAKLGTTLVEGPITNIAEDGSSIEVSGVRFTLTPTTAVGTETKAACPAPPPRPF